MYVYALLPSTFHFTFCIPLSVLPTLTCATSHAKLPPSMPSLPWRGHILLSPIFFSHLPTDFAATRTHSYTLPLPPACLQAVLDINATYRTYHAGRTRLRHSRTAARPRPPLRRADIAHSSTTAVPLGEELRRRLTWWAGRTCKLLRTADIAPLKRL